ncbi:MAG: hypothetical protein QXL16_01290 [Candidatus Micrarchaeaceae archaeon]
MIKLKVFKYNNKLAIYLPSNVINALEVKEGEEVNFLEYGERTFIFAKEKDLVNLITKGKEGKEENKEIGEEEIAVLKKLDTLKFNERSKENVDKIISEKERGVLNRLISKKVISLYSKDGKELYSISKSAYDRFLMRKKSKGESERSEEKDETIKRLFEKGYLVVPTEIEAEELSKKLEEEIRSGKVIGTKFFNKKYYIATSEFISKNAYKLVEALKKGDKTIDEICKTAGIEEDAARTLLYVLAYQGAVIEKKKDLFALV